MATDLETLRQMRILLDKPEHWTQHVYARDIDGKMAVTISDDAYSFCLYGAQRKLTKDGMLSFTVHQILMEAMETIGSWDDEIGHFNDTHTHDQILALLDAAIEIGTERMKAA